LALELELVDQMPSNATDSSFPDDPEKAKLPKESPASAAYSEIKSIILDAPIGDVYACCCRVEESPRFIKSLRDVQKIDDTHFLLNYTIDNEPRRTVLQIILRVPERRLAWQAISLHFPRGVILFEALSDERTEITIRLCSNIESGTLGRITRDYLSSFKRFVERDATP
jgi:uncharacterized membrane protein